MILTVKWNAAQGLSVTEIFEAGGEESFRQKETEMLADPLAENNPGRDLNGRRSGPEAAKPRHNERLGRGLSI